MQKCHQSTHTFGTSPQNAHRRGKRAKQRSAIALVAVDTKQSISLQPAPQKHKYCRIVDIAPRKLKAGQWMTIHGEQCGGLGKGERECGEGGGEEVGSIRFRTYFQQTTTKVIDNDVNLATNSSGQIYVDDKSILGQNNI